MSSLPDVQVMKVLSGMMVATITTFAILRRFTKPLEKEQTVHGEPIYDSQTLMSSHNSLFQHSCAINFLHNKNLIGT